MRCRASRAALIAALLLLAAAPLAIADEFDAQALQAVANSVAADLLRGIKGVAGGGPVRIAVQPFRPDAIVDANAVARLNDAIEIALKAAGGSTITLIDRSRLADVWREAQEFQPDAKLEQQLRDAGAEVLVLGALAPAPQGYQLDYKADDLRPGHTGQVVGVMSAPHVLPFSFAASTGRPLDEAIRSAAIEMADDIADAAPPGRRLQFQSTGETTPFADYAVQSFLDAVQHQLPEARRRHAGAEAVSGAQQAPAPPLRITVRTSVFDLGQWIDVKFAGESPDGGVAPSVMTRISLASIPNSLKPVKPQCGKGVQNAAGEAIVGKLLDHDAARRAARALARARAIAEETCAVFAGPVEIRDAVDAAWAMQAIAGGVTGREQWTDTDLDGGARVRAELTATVRKLGGSAVPTVKAALSAPVITADVPFTFTLSADAPAYVAVFSWQSDDRVLRLYPYGGARELRLAAGQPLTLPRHDEPDLTTEPRPHLSTDFEALIVVASEKPLDYAKMADEPANTLDETMKRAKPVEDLFAALAKVTAPITLTVVPYQIVAKQ